MGISPCGMLNTLKTDRTHHVHRAGREFITIQPSEQVNFVHSPSFLENIPSYQHFRVFIDQILSPSLCFWSLVMGLILVRDVEYGGLGFPAVSHLTRLIWAAFVSLIIISSSTSGFLKVCPPWSRWVPHYSKKMIFSKTDKQRFVFKKNTLVYFSNGWWHRGIHRVHACWA